MFEQVGDLALLAGLPQSLDQVIKRGLILGIDFERFPALNGRFRILSGLQIELRQHPAGGPSVGRSATALLAERIAFEIPGVPGSRLFG